ncbi:MAG: ribosome maturation factor RimP [Blastomonas sp. CACIA14H2]|uniref:ribosome maturation protein RimP n=1 Tax=unclassified Blastomonas TaxID=2626550 RepID=UPI0003CF9F58|nr:ribosome maturation protein RimP [Blastomonas sp. UPD001]ESZ86982.1 MAG: ribosome maturation factor RimP [Blastomonas sp. CACIA14H2]
MTDLAAVAALVEPEATALGFELVRVHLFGAGDDRTLQIMAERPETGQLNIDDCAALSRRISDVFDALEEAGKDPVPGSYRLEVSSPGIDRPLTRLKDYGNWLGHEARLVLTEAAQGRKQLTGELLSLEGDMISVNDKKVGSVTVPFAQVLSAKLMLTNKLIAATRPLDTSGVDDIEEFEETPDTEALEEQED